MADTTDEFVAQGLKHYPDAMTATAEFRRLVTEKIIGQFRARTWKAWKPNLKTMKSNRSESDGCWIGVSTFGSVDGFKSPVRVESGIAWISSEWDVPRAFEIDVYSGGDWLSEGLKNPQGKGVTFEKGDPACLSIEDDSPAPDLDSIFDRLFTAFDACVATATKVRGR